MTTIEILALIAAVLVLVKFVLILISPKFWMKVATSLMKQNLLMQIIYFVLALIVGYYLYMAGVTIVEVFGLMLFFGLLYGFSMFFFPKAAVDFIKDFPKNRNKLILKAWLPWLIWIVLSLWVLYALFLA